jgi:radical SAM superfamily enzyme
MKRTAHLVQINDVIGNNVILPLAIGVLWQSAMSSCTNLQNWQLGQVIYKKLESENQVQQLAQADLIVFSHYVWNSNYQFDLAKKIKQINPNIVVIVGGPNISANQHDFWDTHGHYVDLALIGEGEDSFSRLLESYPDFKTVPGAWTREFYNGEADRIQHFDYSHSPYLSGFYNHIVAQEKQQGRIIQAVIQTNRGCPYHCTFCEEGRDYKNKMFFYDQKRVQDEVEWCAQNGIEYLTIGDDNWGIIDADVQLMQWIRDCKLKYGYPDIVDATYAKNNPDNLLAMAGLDQEYNTRLIRGITIALQSMNTPTLSAIKRFNLVPEKQQQLIRGLNELRMPTYTEMIWPLPYETYETFLTGIDSTITMSLTNWLGVYPLSLHHGTELYENFHSRFGTIQQHSENSASLGIKEVVNIVNCSDWVDNATLVQGQVLYAWLVSLYYFGFARHCLSQQPSVTKTVDQFVQYLATNPDANCHRHWQLMTNWWHQWSNGLATPELSRFSDQDTTHWSPYTHLASWLQNDLAGLYQDLKNFGLNVDLDLHGVVRYQQTYPYTTDCGQIVTIDHPQPAFANEFEFCRFYYWWRRKRGYSRTIIADSSD